MSLIPSFFGNGRTDNNNIFDVWDPFRDLPFPFPSALAARGENSPAFSGARVDWRETPEAHVFKADLPGVRKEEVKVEVEEGRVLQISGERAVEEEDRGDTWHRMERSSGKFVRRFRLPDGARMDGVRAAMEDGVLTVTVPKEEVKRPAVRSVPISG